MKKFDLKKILRKTFLGALFLFGCTCAAADQFYVTAGFDCKPENSSLIIWFDGHSNEIGKNHVENLTANGFNPISLVEFIQNSNGKYLIKTKSEYRGCNIDGKQYLIEFSPLLAIGFHPEGFCATRIGAKVTVKINQKIIINEGLDGCTEKGEVTTRVVMKDHKVLVYEKTSAEEFYGR